MRQFKRSVRLGEQMLRDISSLMLNELADHLPGLVTFTHVRVSDDLRYATVYYSFLGKASDREVVAGYLAHERKHIQHLIGRNLQIRRIPELTFKFDPSIEEGIRIEQLLNEIKSNSKE
ncbi:MAG: 30S ribosome-binding factor RbfA [Deltaproteobacteria bacterium]|nr:30S ribosome-binding factor RbfA [Deltaproteobacteria bacterium]